MKKISKCCFYNKNDIYLYNKNDIGVVFLTKM